jgi:hypothetical protein
MAVSEARIDAESNRGWWLATGGSRYVQSAFRRIASGALT